MTHPMTVEQMNAFCSNSLISTLGIEFTEFGDDFVKAKMPVDTRTVQPMGLLHGGASAALVESLGSVGSALQLDLQKQSAVGLEVNTNHIRSARAGYVHGTATALHLGRRTHVWDVRIVDDEKRLISTGRLTMMIVNR